MKFFIFVLFLFIQNTSFADFIHIPNTVKSDTPVFLALHGCKQTPQTFLKDTFLLDYSSKDIVIYAPKQYISNNIDHCWNWFLSQNQTRFSFGETQQMMFKLNLFLKTHGFIENKVYIIGLSAGAAQGMNLLSCYPERFSGAALFAGLPFRVTKDIFNINRIVANGTDRSFEALSKDFARCSKNFNSYKNKKLLFFHGDQDRRVSIKHFDSIKEQMLGAYDLLDDGIINDSLVQKEVSYLAEQEGRYDTSVDEYYLKSNSFFKFYFIHGLAHEWSGGPYKIERNDPHGPDMTKLILKTFL